MPSPAEHAASLLRDFDSDDASAISMLCDRHPDEAVAFTLVDDDLSTSDITFGELKSRSARFAAGLSTLGVQPGDRVATLMGKGLDYLTAVVGIWRSGAVYVPLFTAFGPQAIATRLARSGAVAVVTDASPTQQTGPGPGHARRRTVAGRDYGRPRRSNGRRHPVGAARQRHFRRLGRATEGR